MSKITVSNVYQGQTVLAGYKRSYTNFIDKNTFKGFKVGGNTYSNLRLLKMAFGVSNLKQLEYEADRLELGSVTAEFYDTDGEFSWAAYLWNGAFRVGTSADRLTLN
jgi:hypothetical protein